MKDRKFMPNAHDTACDIFIIGGGINGCGIARDAAGRGLSVELAEMNDLASATSSASTKLLHGGLRYLEYFKFRLVREALIERETLLRAMPHISRPMRFVLPYHEDLRFEISTPASRVLSWVVPWMKGCRPAWLIRFGLFLYDHLGGRKFLPGTSAVDLRGGVAGKPLQERFAKAYEYSDCWIDDARLVVLNARDAVNRGAKVHTRTKVVSAKRAGQLWCVTTEDIATGEQRETFARLLVNAAGPWVGELISNTIQVGSSEGVRLVRGSHIVTQKLFDHDKGYFFQGEDGRIIFAIPYENNFTLIGTTDADHKDVFEQPVCTEEEADYLCAFASEYFDTPISREDIVWSYSGVRPLYDDGSNSATAATRDYVLKIDGTGGVPVLNVFGGKISTYRKLAEQALEKISVFFPQATGNWTADVSLPGGDFPVDNVSLLISQLKTDYPFLDRAWAGRLIRTYGTEASAILGDAKKVADLGKQFGATLTEKEVSWSMEQEYSQSAEDVVWRRTKLGLLMDCDQISVLDQFIKNAREKNIDQNRVLKA